MRCQIQLFERCTASGRAGFTSQTPIAHINFSGETPQSLTTKQSDGYYTGASDLASSDAWDFDDVEAPLHAGYSCSYPQSYYCGTMVDGEFIISKQGQGILASGANYNASLVATPSATTNQPSDLQVDCQNDIVCKFIELIKQFFVGLFVPSSDFNEVAFQETKDQLTSHAPFAYVYPIFSFSTTDPATSSALPNFQFTSTSLGPTIVGGIDPSLTVIATTIATIKTVLRFALYGAFVVYMFLLTRRILPQ